MSQTLSCSYDWGSTGFHWGTQEGDIPQPGQGDFSTLLTIYECWLEGFVRSQSNGCVGVSSSSAEETARAKAYET